MQAVAINSDRTINKAEAVDVYTVLTPNRSRALATAFKQFAILTENAIFNMMGNLCDEYNGAYWQFYSLSNGGFFMAPESIEQFRLQNVMNYADETLSAEAAGIVVCLMIYSALSFETRNYVFSQQHTFLMRYARNHAEWDAIANLID